MLKLGSKGDTIVEVLLAIAVVSAVLGGAYVATNRSLGGVRRSQERGEALKLVEGQLESLKAAARTSNDVFTTSTNPFCLGNNLTPTNNPATCNQGPDGRYRLAIQRSPSGDGYVFTASAMWDRFGGGGQDQVEILYKVYQDETE